MFCELQRDAAKKKNTEDVKQTDTTAEGKAEGKKAAKGKKKKKEVEEEEEIPQLVPIETPSKKPKLEVSAVHSYKI